MRKQRGHAMRPILAILLLLPPLVCGASEAFATSEPRQSDSPATHLAEITDGDPHRDATPAVLELTRVDVQAELNLMRKLFASVLFGLVAYGFLGGVAHKRIRWRLPSDPTHDAH